ARSPTEIGGSAAVPSSGVGSGGIVVMTTNINAGYNSANFCIDASGGSSGGAYLSAASCYQQHPVQQPHHHQPHQQSLEPGLILKPIVLSNGPLLGGQGYADMPHHLHHQHHQHHFQHPQEHYVQQLQLPLTEPLLQHHQQQPPPPPTVQSEPLGAHFNEDVDQDDNDEDEIDETGDDGDSNLLAAVDGGTSGALTKSRSSKKQQSGAATGTGGGRKCWSKTAKSQPEELQRREKRRERNRVAAAKCRKKRQDRIECLTEAVRGLESDNAQLESTVSHLISRRSQLIGEVRAHRLRCPDSGELLASADAAVAESEELQHQPAQASLSSVGEADEGSESCLSSSSRCGGGGGLGSSFGSGALGGSGHELQPLGSQLIDGFPDGGQAEGGYLRL
ncbi:hypothetical protein BOX15_Mlig024519g1, partial [Macrostomum lignano]